MHWAKRKPTRAALDVRPERPTECGGRRGSPGAVPSADGVRRFSRPDAGRPVYRQALLSAVRGASPCVRAETAASLLPDTDCAEASGVLSTGGRDVPVIGFVARGDAAAPSRHAISLTVADPGTGTATSLAGVLDAARGTLRLSSLSSAVHKTWRALCTDLRIPGGVLSAIENPKLSGAPISVRCHSGCGATRLPVAGCDGGPAAIAPATPHRAATRNGVPGTQSYPFAFPTSWRKP